MATSKKKSEKWLQYSVLIASKIQDMIDEGEISIKDLSANEGENLKEFLHAVATVVPAQIYNKMTSSKVDFLAFNHIANQLCFEYMHKA